MSEQFGKPIIELLFKPIQMYLMVGQARQQIMSFYCPKAVKK